MSTESSTAADPGTAAAAPAASPPRSGVHRARARRLLVGGLVGGVLAGIVAGVVTTSVWGLPGALAALLGAFVVLAFYLIGQGVLVLLADADPLMAMSAAVGSYALRITLLGGFLLAYNRFGPSDAVVPRLGLTVAILITLLGWLAGEIRAWRRLRIPHFDDPAETATGPVSRGGAEK